MQYYFAIIKYYIALSAGGGDSRIFQPLFSMSTFQERILAASGSSSSTADTDPELYRYRSVLRPSCVLPINPLRLLGGVPRILQLPCLVDRTARPVSRLVDVPRRARRSRTAQPRTRAPLRRGVAAPYPVGNLHDGLLRALRARQRDGVVSLRRLCGRAGRCCGRGGGAVGRRCRLPCAGVRLHRRIRLFSTVVFSPRQFEQVRLRSAYRKRSNKFDIALAYSYL